MNDADVRPLLRFAELPALDPALVATIDTLWWPMARIGEALEILARQAGAAPVAGAATAPIALPASLADGPSDAIARWVEWAGDRLGVEAEPIETTVPELDRLLLGAAPAIVPCMHAGRAGFFVLTGASRGRPRLLAPDLVTRRSDVATLHAALCWHDEAPMIPEIVALLETAKVPARRRARVQAAMLRERLAAVTVGPCWMIRLPASAPFAKQIAHARLPWRLVGMLAVFAMLYSLEIGGWAVIGEAALGGRLDLGWLAAWVLLVASTIPLRLGGGWLGSTFALDAARLLKSRLMAGALAMELERVRALGVGRLLGRVMEAQSLESLVINGGLGVVVAVLELVFAAWVLSAGAAGTLHVALLVAWLGLTLWLGRRYARRLRGWTDQRLEMTHDLVERMIGHRTRLAQERPGRRDDRDDQALGAYLDATRAVDRGGVPVFAGLASGWMLVGVAALAPAFVQGTAASGAALAISFGGLLIAQRAFGSIASGLAGLAGAAIAWEQVAPIFRAGGRTAAPRPFLDDAALAGVSTSNLRSAVPRTKLVEASGVRFAYTTGGRPVLDGLDLEIRRGDHVLVEGASGGGKSTLASVLTGLRAPQSGLVLLKGLDRHTLGDDWHRLATEAPQFHENHVLSGTFAFNLLMGRQWPPRAADLAEAEKLCRALGLGELLDRMPGGMHQRIGETGWQLSHGEKSRLFLARALLQRAQLTIMDESFAALDPETLAQCLATARAQADTLVVIAHP